MKETNNESNSKKVKINMGVVFNGMRADAALLKEFETMKKAFGSYSAPNTDKVISGLRQEEIDLLMPSIIDVYPNDKDFRKEVRRYFAGKMIHIYFGSPMILEIGKVLNNDAPLSKENLPISIHDFITYRWLTNRDERTGEIIDNARQSGHPEIAYSKDEFNTAVHKAYFENPTDIKMAKRKKVSIEDDAFSQYMLIKEDDFKVETYLSLFGENPTRLDDPVIVLKDKITKEPAKFLNFLKDEEAVTKYLIQSLVWEGHLIKEGSTYMYSDGSKVIGSLADTVSFFNDKRNMKEVNTFKVKLKNPKLASFE